VSLKYIKPKFYQVSVTESHNRNCKCELQYSSRCSMGQELTGSVHKLYYCIWGLMLCLIYILIL